MPKKELCNACVVLLTICELLVAGAFSTTVSRGLLATLSTSRAPEDVVAAPAARSGDW